METNQNFELHTEPTRAVNTGMQPAVGREGKNEEMVFFCVLYNTRTPSCLCGDRRETLSWTCVAASHTQALNSFKRLCAVDAQMHYSSLKPAGFWLRPLWLSRAAR